MPSKAPSLFKEIETAEWDADRMQEFMDTFSPRFLRDKVAKLSMTVSMRNIASQGLDQRNQLASRQRLLLAVVNPAKLELLLRIVSFGPGSSADQDAFEDGINRICRTFSEIALDLLDGRQPDTVDLRLAIDLRGDRAGDGIITQHVAQLLSTIPLAQMKITCISTRYRPAAVAFLPVFQATLQGTDVDLPPLLSGGIWTIRSGAVSSSELQIERHAKNLASAGLS